MSASLCDISDNEILNIIITPPPYEYTDIRNLTNDLLDRNIYIRARIHKTTITGNNGFIILRYQNHTLQH